MESLKLSKSLAEISRAKRLLGDKKKADDAAKMLERAPAGLKKLQVHGMVFDKLNIKELEAISSIHFGKAFKGLNKLNSVKEVEKLHAAAPDVLPNVLTTLPALPAPAVRVPKKKAKADESEEEEEEEEEEEGEDGESEDADGEGESEIEDEGEDEGAGEVLKKGDNVKVYWGEDEPGNVDGWFYGTIESITDKFVNVFYPGENQHSKHHKETWDIQRTNQQPAAPAESTLMIEN